MRHLFLYGCTQCGTGHEANEDHILVGRFLKNDGWLALQVDEDDDYMASHGLLLAVADGIGGTAGGALASKLGLGAFGTQFYSAEKGPDMTATSMDALRAAAERANRTILGVAGHRPEMNQMGCTIAGICLIPHGYVVFHGGDSRVYRFRKGAIRQLTSDDSVVNAAIEAGRMTHDEAGESYLRHTITNCLGSTSFCLRVQPGLEPMEDDVLLACTDGLQDVVSYEEMESILAVESDIGESVNTLMRMAVDKGSRDDISVVAVRM